MPLGNNKKSCFVVRVLYFWWIFKNMKLPENFKQRMQSSLGEADFQLYSDSFQQPAPVSLRINPLKWQEKPDLEPVPWAQMGYYLPDRPSFACDPLWHSGAYYVQEASSMFLEHVVLSIFQDEMPGIVLDLCGAPGGKATHLASIMDGKGLLVANEVIRSRAVVLAENVRKWGQPNVVVTNNDPAHFAAIEGFFDLIVTDAPCSGEGMFRKNNEAINEWSEANVKLCAVRQQRILSDVWAALKPGGVLIYSTCTFNEAENEDNTFRFISENSAESIKIDVPEQWNVVESEKEGVFGYRFFPYRVKGEGFFITAMRKTTGKCYKFSKKMDVRTFIPVPKRVCDAQAYFASDRFVFMEDKKRIVALDKNWVKETDFLRGKLKVIHNGIAVGALNRNEMIPEHDFVLSPFLKADYYKSYELSFEEAQRFIARESFNVEGLEKGQRYRAIYRNVALGAFKFLGNRINTSLPAEWRLRKVCTSDEGHLL